MEKRFRMLYDRDIVESIRGLMAKTSELKSSIFRGFISESPIDKQRISAYMLYVNGYLKEWEDFAIDMKEKMSNATGGTTPARTVGYQWVKDYIYGKYDYSAMISYPKVLSAGIKNGEIKSKTDVDECFQIIANKAFGDIDRPDSIAGLLDSLLGDNLPDSSDDNDRRMFNAIKHNKDMFRSADRATLYNSTKDVLMFLSDKDHITNIIPASPVTLYVSCINSILEFVVYSLSMYAVRIYAINLFICPYILNYPCTMESVEPEMHYSDDIDLSVTFMRDADEATYKNPANCRKFVELLGLTSTAMGADGYLGKQRPRHDGKILIHDVTMANNLFAQKLFANDLYISIKDNYGWAYRCRDRSAQEEFNSIIKSLIYNPNQGIAGTSTPKNEFAVIVRGIDCDNTPESYRKLFADLFEFASGVCYELSQLIDAFSVASMDPTTEVVGMNRMAAENAKMLTELYDEMVYLFLQKGKEIETRYNMISSKKINDIVGLNFDKVVLPERGTTGDITNAVPDAYRMPVSLTDLYALPAFEYYQFYDEAVKEIYSLGNDMYYSEAFNLSEASNKIKAFMIAIGKMIKNWWNTKERQQAMQWATKYGDSVSKMDFTNQTMSILPFKMSGNRENIDISGVYNSLVKGLQGFKGDETFKSADTVTAFIKSLYPAPEVYQWFSNESKSGEAAAKFHSYILFKDISSASSNAEPTINITGNDINTRCESWVDTCKNGKSIFDQLIKMNDDLTKIMDSLQKNIVDKSNQASADKSASEPLSSAQTTNSQDEDKQKTSSTSNTSDKDQNNNSATELANVQLMLTELNLVFRRIYSPMTDICMKYIDAEYRYLKQAYSLGKANSSSTK